MFFILAFMITAAIGLLWWCKEVFGLSLTKDAFAAGALACAFAVLAFI